MCLDPASLFVLSALTTGGGMAANAFSQSSADKSMKRARDRERVRQELFVAEAEAAQRQAQQGFEQKNFTDALGEDQLELGETFQAAQSQQPATLQVGITDTPDEVRQFAKKKSDESSDFTSAFAKNLGNLRGFGQTLFDRNLDTNRSAEATDLSGNFARGSASVLPLEIEEASRKAQSPLGDLLTGIGQIGLTAGLSGGGLGNLSFFNKPAAAAGGGGGFGIPLMA